MGVKEIPADAPFGAVAQAQVDENPDPRQSGDNFERSGSSKLLVPDQGHYIVVQLSGNKKNPKIQEIVGLFYSLRSADMYASKDRGLKVYQVEVLG